MNFFPARCDEEAYTDYVRLFADCFPGVDKFSRDYLDWLYRCNPDGEVLGFDARDGDRLAAHYVCIPARALIGGLEVRVLLSLNTATHPDYQGQGLFTKLAELTYAEGANQGYDCVYGVANSNSTPGFTRKLKFQLVGPLRACVGIGSIGVDFSREASLHFRRAWSAQALAWRCACPTNLVSTLVRKDRTTFLAPALESGVPMAAMDIDTINLIGQSSSLMSPIRLFIGRIPTAWKRPALYIDIPSLLRPSPLNLIYRSLSGRIESIDPDAVFLGFLDFDAY